MGFWENIGDSILDMGGGLTTFSIGKWILIGIGGLIAIAILMMRIGKNG